jgi:hypothetical protein
VGKSANAASLQGLTFSIPVSLFMNAGGMTCQLWSSQHVSLFLGKSISRICLSKFGFLDIAALWEVVEFRHLSVHGFNILP